MSTILEYADYKKKDDIHGTALYPAVMIAPMQKDILEILINDNIKTKIFDPFHGSGTALYESLEVSDNVELYGCDINPLANLITKVKLQGLSNTIDKDLNQLKVNLKSSSENCVNHEFINIKKWFRDDIIVSLSIIRNSIVQIKSKQNRLYFWYIFSNIVRKYSNTRSSTYKLHIKQKEKIKSLNNNVIDDYLNKVETERYKFTHNFNDFILYKSDILDIIKIFENKFFNISITSPPYGDNATTVPYGQFSMLPLYWMDSKDLELEGWELDNYSIIDNKSLGGKNDRLIVISCENIELIKPYLTKISDRKTKKVIAFFNDYFLFLEQLVRVTDKYIIMTLGNRTVDNININLTDITMQFLKKRGFKNIKYSNREIPIKRIPDKVSQVNNKPVSSINEEFIIVHEREL